MDDQQFRQLLGRFGFSWDGYRKVRRGVKKRISRHMQQVGCRTMQAYFSTLDQDKDAKQDFERLMTVSISRFFRDRGLWQTIEDKVLPAIIKKNSDTVKIWSAGCGCGEEVYTFKILWDTAGQRFQPLPELEIWATDMNPLYLNKAKAGIYPPSSLKEVPEALLSRYFRSGSKRKSYTVAELEIWATDMNPVYLNKARAGIYPPSSLKEVPEALRALYFRSGSKRKSYTVAEPLKRGIVWQNHNLLFDPPGNKFRLVFLRNSLLTYYEDKLKAPAFQKVLDSLAQRGFLIIGAHEKIPPGVRGLLPFAHHPYIYQKKVSVDCC